MKILFITHEVSLTGAPAVLLHLLKWLRTNKENIVVDVITLDGGGLEQEFQNVTNNYYDYRNTFHKEKTSFFKRVLIKLKLTRKANKKQELFQELITNNYDLIYANTVVSLKLASELVEKMKACKLVAHIHELNAIIKMMLPNFKDYSKKIDHFIVPSEIVKTNLVGNWGVSSKHIDVVYECTRVKNSVVESHNKSNKKVFTIGASGTVHWRKGYDVFLQLARYIKDNYPEVLMNFVWVGKIIPNEKIILEEDIRKLGLKDVITFTGEVKDPSGHFKDFDVFVMPSREDPFPLVCIEVGMLGKPIISFENAVGTNEVLVKGGGFIVPYLNIEQMAEKVITYYKNPDLLKKHGDENKKSFSHFTPEDICPQLFKVIESLTKHEA